MQRPCRTQLIRDAVRKPNKKTVVLDEPNTTVVQKQSELRQEGNFENLPSYDRASPSFVPHKYPDVIALAIP